MEIDTLFGEPYAAASGQAEHRPRQAAYVVTIMVLGLATAGLGVSLHGSRQSQESWQAVAEQRSEQLASLHAHRDDLQRQLVDAQVALTSAEESMAATRAELDEATRQVKVLTQEKAGMLDKATFMPAALAMATELAQAVSSCVLVLEGGDSGQPPTVPAAAEPAALVAPAVQGDRPCDRARADSEALTKWLGSQ